MKVQDALNTIIESADMSARMAMTMFVLIKWNQAVWALTLFQRWNDNCNHFSYELTD